MHSSQCILLADTQSGLSAPSQTKEVGKVSPNKPTSENCSPKNILENRVLKIQSPHDPARTPRHDWTADLILLATTIIWGVNIVAFKAAITGNDPYVFNAQRLTLAMTTLVLLAVAESMLYPQNRSPRSPVPWLSIAVFSLLNGVIYLLTYVRGISMTTAGNVALIFASLPMWTAVYASWILKERFSKLTWIGLFITALGTLVVILNGAGPVNLSTQYFQGNAWILLATLAWAAATIVSRNILTVLTPLQLAALASLMTTPIHWIVAWKISPQGLFGQQTVGYWAAMAYSGIFSTGIAYATWNAGVYRVGAAYASIYQNVVTLVAVLGGWLMLNEQLLPVQLLGGALTVIGLLTMRHARHHHHADPVEHNRCS
ncbi:MAG TPA: hypothetical protein DCF63_06615 [Planctomycetaceae bacterium]|nr:hypothetical protein [Planctomycetaceae bacterium]